MADLERLAGPDTAPERHVIFIHGLNGDSLETWRSRSPENAGGSGWKSWIPFFGTKPSPELTAGELWPEWLASDIERTAVWTVGYPAAVSNWTGKAMYLADRAVNVYERLLAEEKLAAGELIFVGHSFGGLVIKQLLRKASDEAHNNRRAEAGKLIERTRKVAFLATPHNGADLANWINCLQFLFRPSETVISLARNDAGLRELNQWYRSWAGARGIDHLILVEKNPTYGVVVVKPDSADPGLSQSPTPIGADHIAIAKPASRSNEIYKLVLSFIKRTATTYVSPEERAIERVGDDTQAIREKVEQLINKVSLTDQQREELVADLAKIKAEHNGTIELVAGFLETMVGKKVPPTEFASTLFNIVAAWKAAGEKINALTFSANSQPHFGALRDEARAAHRAGRLDEAERLLARIAQEEIVALERLESHHREIDQDIKIGRKGVAETKFAQAAVAHARLDYLAAAAIYGEAARFVESYDTHAYVDALLAQAYEFYAQGDEFGDNDGLQQSIRLYRLCIDSIPRDQETLMWAATQNNLGNALLTLGERESGTARLEESVEAYRKVLKEYTRDQDPLLWAAAQNNLGNALWSLGERESGTVRLTEAVAAYREALREYTRDRVPLDWAMTQNNLGNALRSLGERESGTERLTEAVAAYREALREYTRDRVPLDWAMTQMRLGNALGTIGQRESGTERLTEAVSAFRDALRESTRERVPLRWAETQNNLGNALQILGERESGTERLTEAVVAYREALRENTRDRVPRQWAATQNNLGNALQTLGQRESGTERLTEAVAAYRDAMEERTRDRVPLDWARSFGNQGVAMIRIAERTEDAYLAAQAVEQINEAYETCLAGGHVSNAELYKKILSLARGVLSRLRGDA